MYLKTNGMVRGGKALTPSLPILIRTCSCAVIDERDLYWNVCNYYGIFMCI